jgi:hypothetical protein
MCQVIFLGSVEPLPESDTLAVRRADDLGLLDAEVDGLLVALPEARHFYRVGGCQCHFRHSTESEIADIFAYHQERNDLQMADSTRAYLRGVNAFVASLADYLADNLAQTRIWMVWQPGGRTVSPGCAGWVRTPSYFRRPDFTMPPAEGVITLVSDGIEQPPLAERLAQMALFSLLFFLVSRQEGTTQHLHRNCGAKPLTLERASIFHSRATIASKTDKGSPMHPSDLPHAEEFLRKEYN